MWVRLFKGFFERSFFVKKLLSNSLQKPFQLSYPYILLKGANGLFDLGILLEFPFYLSAGVYGGGVVLAPERRAYFREREAAEPSCHVHRNLYREREVL